MNSQTTRAQSATASARPATTTRSPIVSRKEEKEGVLKFTISNVDVCFVNAIRRAILSDLEVVVFKTAPYEENKCVISENTIAGINNQFIEHRLSGIPIHITDIAKVPLQNYLVELDKENITDTVMYVTTADFRIKNITTGRYLSEQDTRQIFPPDSTTGDNIMFVRLKPRLAENIPGESIKLTAEFSRERISKNGMYIVASTCAYGDTPDQVKMDAQIPKEIEAWKASDTLTKEQLDMKISNWKLLDGLRITVPNSFDFILESVGVYTNKELIIMACDYLLRKLSEVRAYAEAGEIEIAKSTQTTTENCFEVHLTHDEGYTIGVMLEKSLYYTHFEGTKTIAYIGGKKKHPHENIFILRLAYVAPVEIASIMGDLTEACERCSSTIRQIRANFAIASAPAAASTKAAATATYV